MKKIIFPTLFTLLFVSLIAFSQDAWKPSGGSGGGGGLSISGSDNQVVRVNGTSAIQNSSVVLSDTNIFNTTSADIGLATLTSGDITLDPAEMVGITLNATGAIEIDATSTPHTGTGGVSNLDLTTATSLVSAYNGAMTVTDDIRSGAVFEASATKTTNGLASPHVIYGHSSVTEGHASDTGGEYIHFASFGHTKNGGTSTSVAFDAGNGDDYAFRATGGDIGIQWTNEELFLIDSTVTSVTAQYKPLATKLTVNNSVADADPAFTAGFQYEHSGSGDLTTAGQPHIVIASEFISSGTGDVSKVDNFYSGLTTSAANTISSFSAYSAGSNVGATTTVTNYYGFNFSDHFGASTPTNIYAYAYSSEYADATNTWAMRIHDNSSGPKYVIHSDHKNAASTRRTSVSSTPYTALVTDDLPHVTHTGTAATTINLPAAATAGDGFTLTIVDAGLNADFNNITIDGNGSETINGSTTFTMNTPGHAITIYTDGSNWFIKSDYKGPS